MNKHEFALAEAAQVPVVGEPVAWLINSPPRRVHLSKSTEVGLNGATQEPLYLAPTNYIPATELDSLRKDAERWEAVVIISQAALCLPETRDARHNAMIREYQRAVNDGQDLTSAIDTVIAQGKEE